MVRSLEDFGRLQIHAGRELQKGDDPRTDHRRGFTRISRAGIPKRPLPNCQAGPTALSTPLFSTPRCRGVGTPSWAGPLTTSLRGLWVSGYLPRAMADRAQGRRPDNRPGGDDSDPGLASRRERGLNCHQTEYSRTSVDCVNAKRGGGPKTPLYEGKGPENPGVVAPTSLPSSSTVVIQPIDKVLNFPAVLRRHGTHRAATRCLLRLQPEFHFCCPYRDCIMSIFLDDGTPCDCHTPPVIDVGRFSVLACCHLMRGTLQR